MACRDAVSVQTYASVNSRKALNGQTKGTTWLREQ